jgi:hypothetical protein
MTLRLCSVAALLLAMLVPVAVATAASIEKGAQAEGRGALNLDAVNVLFDLMDVLVSKNPTYPTRGSKSLLRLWLNR